MLATCTWAEKHGSWNGFPHKPHWERGSKFCSRSHEFRELTSLARQSEPRVGGGAKLKALGMLLSALPGDFPAQLSHASAVVHGPVSQAVQNNIPTAVGIIPELPFPEILKIMCRKTRIRWKTFSFLFSFCSRTREAGVIFLSSCAISLV